ncbi:titin-like isoform 2-T2 [Leptodactylus fuscus]|uniref:titin-like isoform X2 n=1 Tax=Leptodactylus fuscus TaxID=238119 RepID=UPI003F4EB3C6
MPGSINVFLVFLLGITAMENTEAQSPNLRLEPEQIVYIAGESLSLRCVADMPSSITGYSFFKDGRVIANNSASNTFIISSLSVTDAGNYFCTYYREAESRITESNHMFLRVFERPIAPTLSVEPQRRVFLVNQAVIIRCNLPGSEKATEVDLYKDGTITYDADNFGVLSLLNTEKRNTGNYSCQYKSTRSARIVDSHPSNQEALAVIDLPPTPVLRYANRLQNQNRQVEIVCEIPNLFSSSLIHGYCFYRNGGEISCKVTNQFVMDYDLEFDGCYFCRSFVNVLGEKILSDKSTEIFLTTEESNTRSCQTPNSTSGYGLSRQGICS